MTTLAPLLCAAPASRQTQSQPHHSCLPVKRARPGRQQQIVRGPDVVRASGAAQIAQYVLTDSGLFVGAFAAATLLAVSAFIGFTKAQEAQGAMATATAKLQSRKNAVLVFGATGKLGREIVSQILESQRTVVAAVREEGKAGDVLPEDERLVVKSGIDVTNPSTLGKDLFEGVTQVVSAVGPTFSRTEEGPKPGTTSEDVDAKGVANIAEAWKAHRAQKGPERLQREELVSMRSPTDLGKWQRLDDVIMGGKSESRIQLNEEGIASWTGTLRVEGGGFCGLRTRERSIKADWSRFQGLSLRVKGDGQTFKVNLKTADQVDRPERTYQATFDTVEGEWANIYLPWRDFVPVIRAKVDSSAPTLNPAKIEQLGLVLSRFEFNELPNLNYHAGDFELQVSGGFYGFTAPKPSLLLVSSAATERNALIGEDSEARKADIPIVQLNPGGVLNHKYAGEQAVRGLGLPYTVIRPVGLVSGEDMQPAALEYSQGDRISGKITRKETAAAVLAALGTDAATNKTFEVRRSEAGDAQGKAPDRAELQRLLLPLAEDRHRPRIGLRPLPASTPPPPPPSKERLQEILNDSRVQAAAKRDREQGTNEASAATSQAPKPEASPAKPEHSAAKPELSTAKPEAPKAEAKAEPAAPSHSESQNGASGGNGAEAPRLDQQKQEARQWIDSWRERSNGASSASTGAAQAAQSNGAGSNGSGNGAGPTGPSSAEQNGASAGSNAPETNTVDGLPAELVARKEDAQGWIQSWRERSGAK